MQFTLQTLLSLGLAATALAGPITLSKRTNPPAVPSCVPLSKLTQQLTSFTTQSAAVIRDAATSSSLAQADAAQAIAEILSPIDLLNPQVQGLQNTILADLSIVGDKFRAIEATWDQGVQEQIAWEVVDILSNQLWPNAVTISFDVATIGDCSSGAVN